MKRQTNVLLAVLTICTVGLIASVTRADVTLNDDFDAYALGSWPAGWVANANAVNDPSRNNIVADPTDPDNHVFRLYGRTSGSWGANAFADFDFPESYTLDITVRNGSEVTNGVQPGRAALHMRHGTDWPAWTNPARSLLYCNINGNIEAGDGRVLQTYVTDRWYDVTIQYDRVGTDLTLQYWINGVDRGASQIVIPDLAVELSFDHVGLTAVQGSAYFDNLSVVPKPAPPQPKTYGVFIGSNDYGADGVIRVNGQADADAVHNAFSQLVNFDDHIILKYDVTDVNDNPQTSIENALSNLSDKVSPGDNLIFFYSGHGGGSTTDDSVDESLFATMRSNTGEVLDDELTDYFLDPARRDTWRDVNKLFILDSCHAGGFWGGEDSDLSSIGNAALLAAASELEYGLASVEDNGQGFFAMALADGLLKTGGFAAADTNKNGLTVQELADFLDEYPSYQDGITGFIKDGWPDDLVSIGWNSSMDIADDFTMSIPEPATLSLLAMGSLSLLRRRREH